MRTLKDSPKRTALRDMAKHFENVNNKFEFKRDGSGECDIWFTSPYMLDCVEVRFLNGILGLRGINHIGNIKGFKKQTK